MQIEVVIPSPTNPNGLQVFNFAGVSAPEISGIGVLEVWSLDSDDNDGESVADFKQWCYWRKTED